MSLPPRYDQVRFAELGRSEEGCRLLRMKDETDLYVLDDAGAAYDHLFAVMAEHFTAGGGFLYLAQLVGLDGPLHVLEVSATKSEALVRGKTPEFAGQVLRVWLYAAGGGAEEFLELKRTRDYTKIHKLPPVSSWPGLWPPDSSPPVEPAVLGWLRSLAAGDVGRYLVR